MLGGYGRLEAVLGGEVPAADVAVLGPRNQHPLVLHEGLHTWPNFRMVIHHKADLTPCKCTSSIGLLRGTTIVCPDIMSRQASLCE